ncbi:hypothetical protein TSUD_104520 [Trifolium subterraneum]|uniref:Reverse transcriptase zinc-binding domain-containing protein n=1 Tax=Trifolium subterraneum TaxID=3900 RepID=A0A2Z6MAT4_TRISU|nr:hypothetical protein TSUD_104520 [Trifolium subterraneum]
MDILKTYEDASGQEVNMAKSEVFFSRNLSSAAQEDLSRLMGVKHVLGTGTYLGLPSMVGRSKKNTFAYVKDRIWKRINSWRGRALSKAAERLVPDLAGGDGFEFGFVFDNDKGQKLGYDMYLIPETNIKEIERMLNSFWWGGGSNNGGIKWLAWDRIPYLKAYGGLGFRNLHLFNMAMVAKQGWKFATNPNSLVARVYKARYFPNSTFFASHLGNNPSYAWRSIWKSRQVLMNGCRWRIGDGTKINVTNEPWLRMEDGKWMQSPQDHEVSNLYVNQLMLPNEKVWDSNKIHTLFSSNVANSILAVPLFDNIGEDYLVWDDDTHGNYNVKSGYNLLLQSTLEASAIQEEEDWKWLWKIQAPPKTKHLLWRICRGCLPTRSRLKERNVQCTTSCPICEEEEENDWHLLYDCETSKRAWRSAGIVHIIQPHVQQAITTKECIMKLCRNSDRKEAGKAAMLIWMLWKNRNNCVWNHEKEQGQELGIKALSYWHEWEAVQNTYSSGRNQVQKQLLSWKTPPQGKHKCNVDMGCNAAARKTSAGWCVRDYRGQFVFGGSSWIHGKCSINEGEALALLEAMKELQQQRGFKDVIFETDAQNIVYAFHHRNTGRSEFSSIIHKIKCILSLNSDFEWQGAPSKDVSGEYRVRFPGGTTLGQCACLYARAGLVVHLCCTQENSLIFEGGPLDMAYGMYERGKGDELTEW